MRLGRLDDHVGRIWPAKANSCTSEQKTRPNTQIAPNFISTKSSKKIKQVCNDLPGEETRCVGDVVDVSLVNVDHPAKLCVAEHPSIYTEKSNVFCLNMLSMASHCFLSKLKAGIKRIKANFRKRHAFEKEKRKSEAKSTPSSKPDTTDPTPHSHHRPLPTYPPSRQLSGHCHSLLLGLCRRRIADWKRRRGPNCRRKQQDRIIWFNTFALPSHEKRSILSHSEICLEARSYLVEAWLSGSSDKKHPALLAF